MSSCALSRRFLSTTTSSRPRVYQKLRQTLLTRQSQQQSPQSPTTTTTTTTTTSFSIDHDLALKQATTALLKSSKSPPSTSAPVKPSTSSSSDFNTATSATTTPFDSSASKEFPSTSSSTASSFASNRQRIALLSRQISRLDSSFRASRLNNLSSTFDPKADQVQLAKSKKTYLDLMKKRVVLWMQEAGKRVEEDEKTEVRVSAVMMPDNDMDHSKGSGNKKSITFKMPFLHVEYTRFITLCDQVKGLSLDSALLQLRWHRKPITDKFLMALEEAMVKAHKNGLDLSKTYIADAFTQKENSTGTVISSAFAKKYIRGRGRYGSTPHFKLTLLKLELQQREKPFKVRETDPLEWIRVRLRERMRDQNDAGTAASGGGGSDLVRQVLKKRVGQVPEKPVFC